MPVENKALTDVTTESHPAKSNASDVESESSEFTSRLLDAKRRVREGRQPPQ